MDVQHLCWLREYMVKNPAGQDVIAMEFSYDSGAGNRARFFRVPEEDFVQARGLYAEWGGERAQGYRVGTAVRGPGLAFTPSVQVWRENG